MGKKHVSYRLGNTVIFLCQKKGTNLVTGKTLIFAGRESQKGFLNMIIIVVIYFV
jgi:hypothetical protein